MNSKHSAKEENEKTLLQQINGLKTQADSEKKDSAVLNMFKQSFMQKYNSELASLVKTHGEEKE